MSLMDITLPVLRSSFTSLQQRPSLLPLITILEWIEWMPPNSKIYYPYPQLVKPKVLRSAKTMKDPVSKSASSFSIALSQRCIRSLLHGLADVRMLSLGCIYIVATWNP